MTTFTRDDDSNEYLWDRSGPVDPAVAGFERALGPLAYRPARHPLRLPPARRRWPVVTAIAAGVVIAAAASLFYWRLAWPAGRAWPMELAGQSGALAVGQTLRLDGASSASIDVARLGTMRVLPNSAVTLNATASAKHRLRLDRGSVRVSVWSPPSRVVFSTPSGEVIDLGCVFTLSVDEAGAAHVAVETGWVQLENGHGEVLVPAGASTAMSAAGQPLVPIFDDATVPFRDAVRAIEAGPIDDSAPAWRNIRREARPRDVLTLLMLALRLPDSRRGALLEHAATLAPPPRPPAAGVASLDDAAVWEWFDSLPLPPAKAWWRNWKDVFRR
ncbi:MAG TPA: FecR domain-containing protein [Vicinamibacterales bacterium]|jgi:hypothetical protein